MIIMIIIAAIFTSLAVYIDDNINSYTSDEEKSIEIKLLEENKLEKKIQSRKERIRKRDLLNEIKRLKDESDRNINYENLSLLKEKELLLNDILTILENYENVFTRVEVDLITFYLKNITDSKTDNFDNIKNGEAKKLFNYINQIFYFNNDEAPKSTVEKARKETSLKIYSFLKNKEKMIKVNEMIKSQKSIKNNKSFNVIRNIKITK